MTVQFRRRPAQPAAARLSHELQPPQAVRPELWPAEQQLYSALTQPADAASAPRRAGLLRRLLRLGYRGLRPLLRPVALRARAFLLAEVTPELQQLRANQQSIGRDLETLAAQDRPAGDGGVVAGPPGLRAGTGPRPGLHKVHQFHAGSASGDAITNAMLLLRARLRAAGYESEIYVEHLAPELAGTLLPLDALPRQADHVLLVHHSMGHRRFAEVTASPAPKVLIYHNITPPELLGADDGLRQAARLGRAQLRQWRDLVVTALADSAFNALELRQLGFPSVAEATLLFDTEALLARAEATPRRKDQPFTVLFVGRMVASKGQAALVEAFAAFAPAYAREHGAAPRLVLAGAHGGGADPALREVLQRVDAHRLGGQVIVTGKLDDDALRDWYARADLYVSLSRHEGFGVPLVEALAQGLRVVALAAAAVPYTLGGHGTLVADDTPELVAAAMLDLARAPRADAAGRAEALAPWRWATHWPVLEQALARAGAAPAADPRLAALIADRQHVAVTGQINGSYSLAVVNRQLALALDSRLPGQTRLLPVENDRPAALAEVPPAQRRALEELVRRPPPLSGPVVALSQHYPLLVPEIAADLTVAMLFWEETKLPDDTVRTLNTRFAGVLAPSLATARALADSGVRVPIRWVGFAADLQRFAAIGAARAVRPPRGAASGVTSFLHVSSCFPRKGVDALLAAWARAFGAGDPVRLVIKGFPNPHNDVAAQIAALRAARPDLAEIVFINRDMPPDALRALYAEADVMVLPSRGEGWNIPAAEALAAGLRLIVTGFGGHMDFCTAPAWQPRTRLLAYRLTRSDSHVADRHALWAEPDGDDLVLALQEAAGQRRAPHHAGAPPAGVLPPDAALWAERITAATAGLLLAAPRARPRIGWVSPWQVTCGIAEYSRHLLEAMAARGAAPLILCDTRPPRDDAADGRWQVRPSFRLGHDAAPGELARAIAAADPDVVMLQHQPGLLSWAQLADLLAHPVLRRRCVVVMLHNTRDLLLARDDIRTLAAEALSGVRRVLVHASADLAVLQDLGVINTAWLPHGATGGPAPRPPRSLAAPDAAPVIGTTGFFLPHKGIAALLQATAILRQSWPGLRLRLVCARYPDVRSDEEIARCEALVRTLELEEAVEWHTGFLPHAQRLELLAGCDLMVMPYAETQESASGAVRQALASGVATLVSDLPIFADLDDAVGRLHGTAPGVIAGEIARMLCQPQLRQALQDRAQDWLRDHAWSRIGQRLEAMLEAYHQEHQQDLVI
jgi:glycosyltransferase involved in cell wall biosynthesis